MAFTRFLRGRPFQTLTISGTPASTADVGSSYLFTPTVTGAAGPLTFSYTGTLPSGTSFSTSTGSISGALTTVEVKVAIVITVSDSFRSVSLGSFSVSVAAAAIATVGPHASWTGTAGTGSATPTQSLRTYAKPIMGWVHADTATEDRFSGDYYVGCVCEASGGISKVRFSGDIAQTDVTQKTVRMITDPRDGSSFPLEAYWIKLNGPAFTAVNGTTSKITIYAEGFPTNVLMQTRVIGGDRTSGAFPGSGYTNWTSAELLSDMNLYPRTSTAFDFDKTIGASGADYTTIAAWTSAFRTAVTGGATNGRATFITPGATYTVDNSIPPSGFVTATTGYNVFRCDPAQPAMSVTIQRGSSFDPLGAADTWGTTWDWWPGIRQIKFEGPGIIIDAKNFSSIVTDTTSFAPYWFHGCKITNSRQIHNSNDQYWNGDVHPGLYTMRATTGTNNASVFSFTDIEYVQTGEHAYRSFIGCAEYEVGIGRHFTRVMVGNYIRKPSCWGTSFANPERLHLTYSGASATATATYHGYFEGNSAIAIELYDNNNHTLGASPLSVSSGSNVVTVTDTAHGLTTGKSVIVSGASAVGGITPNTVTSVQVTVINANSYSFTFTSNATSTTTGGGSSVVITKPTYTFQVANVGASPQKVTNLLISEAVTAINSNASGWTATEVGNDNNWNAHNMNNGATVSHDCKSPAVGVWKGGGNTHSEYMLIQLNSGTWQDCNNYYYRDIVAVECFYDTSIVRTSDASDLYMKNCIFDCNGNDASGVAGPAGNGDGQTYGMAGLAGRDATFTATGGKAHNIVENTFIDNFLADVLGGDADTCSYQQNITCTAPTTDPGYKDNAWWGINGSWTNPTNTGDSGNILLTTANTEAAISACFVNRGALDYRPAISGPLDGSGKRTSLNPNDNSGATRAASDAIGPVAFGHASARTFRY